MAQPFSLIRSERGFARDYPRDAMPGGNLWDVVDYVPTLIDANLTGRGGWTWGSDHSPADFISGILASFSSGDKLIVVNSADHWFEINQTTGAIVDRGAAWNPGQNPVQFGDEVVHCDRAAANLPQLISAPGGSFVTNTFDPSGFKPSVGCVYKGMFVGGGMPHESDTAGDIKNNRPGTVRFSVPGFGLGDPKAFDPMSFINTSQTVTALAPLRTMVLVFHKGSTERIRGVSPPTTVPAGETNKSLYEGDMFLEPAFERVGCVDPKSIAYWNDMVLFADDHGVHMTDGSALRNVTEEGGILSYWRPLFQNKAALAACTYLDYYIITIKATDASAITLLCNLNSRTWFRFSNLVADTYITSPGNMERCWAGIDGTGRLANIDPCFFPTLDAWPLMDANGVPVLPSFETPWYRLNLARSIRLRQLYQEGRQRVRFMYLSYDARLDDLAQQVLSVDYLTSPQGSYTTAGNLPATDEYTRYRLPIGRFGYGMAFRVRQTQPTKALRIFDLGVETEGVERSRV